jgi:hypothetical protein
VNPRSPTHSHTHSHTHTAPTHVRTRKLKIQRTHARMPARTRARARRSDLKLVLMSATINLHKFSQYFDGAPIVQVTVPSALGWRAWCPPQVLSGTPM